MNPNDKAMVRCPVVNDLKNFMLAPPLFQEQLQLYVEYADHPSV
jgi:hypothetical protein